MKVTLENRSFLGIWVIALVALVFLTVPRKAVAAQPDKTKVIGEPLAIQVQPQSVILTGPHDMRQLIVTGHYADGSVRDLTSFVEILAEANDGFTITEEGTLFPLKNCATLLIVKAGKFQTRVPVTVRGMENPRPISFRNELMAALNVGGCNSGACHGTPTGKNGFKLSLRGYDPASDYIQLTHDLFGRRTDRLGSESALIYQKALGRVPHEGGARFPASSVAAKVLRSWLAEGSSDDPANLAALQKIEVLPGNRVIREPARWQQLAVLATFADGQTHDVTRLTVFTSSDPAIAGVSSSGLVEFAQSGEVAILCRFLEQLVPVRLTFLDPKPGFQWSNPPENNYVDQHIFAKLKLLNILPSGLCTDQEFVRRAYMDVCGLLPTIEETKAFLEDKDPRKRSLLIDQLLDRPEYADQWALKWSDVFRSSRKSIQLKGTHVFQAWLRGHILQNDGFDKIIREVITSSGSTFSNPPANYFRVARDPTSLAETTAQLFFGIRMQCAKCHNHPFERWTQDDYYRMSAWFARVKHRPDLVDGPAKAKGTDGAEFIYVDRNSEITQPRTGKTMAPRFMGSARVPTLVPGKDRREVLADWMTSSDNPFVPKSIVNRVWYHLNGRGIVDPVDDFRDSNPSANDDLLNALAKDFTAHQFDVKRLIATIMNSRTYQLSAQTNEFNKEDTKYFSHAIAKLHTAEQLFDALCFVTLVPEKFAGFPLGTRAMQLPDGESNNPFLKTFGQPARELACECERESDSNLAQALQLINGPAVNDRLRNPANRIGQLLAKQKSEREILEELYLATLSRVPNQIEARAMLLHVNSAVEKRKAWEDVHWALINSKEFLFRH